MKKLICLLAATALLLLGCSDTKQTVTTDPSTPSASFVETDSGSILTPDGVEYVHLAHEYTLNYLGELEFAGYVQGEEKTSSHLSVPYQTGMFTIKDAENDNLLIRRTPNNEWYSIYRKANLPELNYSPDNCIRFEIIPSSGDADHISCGKGITDKAEISSFLSEIQAQQNPHDAGLYDMIENSDGLLENCYVYGIVYGFLAEEPNLVIYMDIFSFNDLGYSIRIVDQEYVLPEAWLQTLTATSCQ